ncbi:hypothetical protein BU23DRAFT_151423 [Bimuria novae-zelandiae CBS 107.79]|uniref:Uncharacterized protein n=1 Tax=Bimuria novae-zelandiae CBS 107.79 TaxID=1447943 RepID=A0A6A5VRQ7_9PLEO|nr:hypothetical protein BU23DRAFT_151423 [Bimuria novae-zelandiae CBS 107.79]
MNTSAKYRPTGPGAGKGDAAPNTRIARSTQAINTPPRHHVPAINGNATHKLFPSNVSTSTIQEMLPVEGMADLQTLCKMHASLTQSHQDYDKNLAAFIAEKYLPKDFGDHTEGGIPLQGAESFTKLYNAYKRVRNLTGRVQDKWPFFDRKWKSMPKNDVMHLMEGNNSTPSGVSTRDSLVSSSVDDTAGNSKFFMFKTGHDLE